MVATRRVGVRRRVLGRGRRGNASPKERETSQGLPFLLQPPRGGGTRESLQHSYTVSGPVKLLPRGPLSLQSCFLDSVFHIIKENYLEKTSQATLLSCSKPFVGKSHEHTTIPLFPAHVSRSDETKLLSGPG